MCFFLQPRYCTFQFRIFFMLEIKRTKFEKQDKRPLWISAPLPINRDLTKLRWQWKGERQKSNRFNEQNNNSERASRVFAVRGQLRREMTNFKNGNGKAINSTISVRTRARSPLFSYNQNSLLLSNRANWIIAKKFKGMWRLFFRDVFIDVAVFAITQSFCSCRGKSNKKPRAVIQAFTVFM